MCSQEEHTSLRGLFQCIELNSIQFSSIQFNGLTCKPWKIDASWCYCPQKFPHLFLWHGINYSRSIITIPFHLNSRQVRWSRCKNSEKLPTGNRVFFKRNIFMSFFSSSFWEIHFQIEITHFVQQKFIYLWMSFVFMLLEIRLRYSRAAASSRSWFFKMTNSQKYSIN